MLAFSGLGCLPIALLGALSVIWFRIIDARGGDWATACLVAVPIALVLGLVNLVVAESLNQAPAPGRLPEGDDTRSLLRRAGRSSGCTGSSQWQSTAL